MDGWIVLKEVGGWSAFGSLALLNVVAFLKGWVYPAGIVEKFQAAWDTERAARQALEESKHPAVLAAIRTNTDQLVGLRTALEEHTALDKRESQ